MGDRVGERLQFPVGLGQLRRALLDSLLQLFVELTDLFLVAPALAYVAVVGDDAPDGGVVEQVIADGLGVAQIFGDVDDL